MAFYKAIMVALGQKPALTNLIGNLEAKLKA